MSVSPRTAFTSAWRDWMGIAASIGCAIHCAAMPFVIAYLSEMGLSYLADEAFHKWMFLVCVVIGLLAFLPGWRKHGRRSPMTIGSAGLALIGFAAFGLAGECCAACELDQQKAVDAKSDSSCCENECCQHEGTVADAQTPESKPVVYAAPFAGAALRTNYAPWITPLGGILLICAHLQNWRFGSVCGCCSSLVE